ncbi:type V CRISPR-associated protein Cas12a/Cpf1 [Synergistes jonesii]|uniref:Type V CRISPR-associated protein Cpf1 n=1 Tax=Synergistes jonesii TaxID=2754 RepID=A0A073IR12_9BACT|nr:type V CRISPR-associated protein Cas12a/Cpf1 [Synergistes jonesii]KEJ92204.1 hypothetical protein EH55_04135 [Synergistes jonesii]OFB62658.1 hypothetical protein JS73_06325 [Synergistes jonesii]OFB63365.1 hypothetical protein JS79_06850 [Synergistes jonesii]OFB65592.1 hypothetical protein JS72_02830 [Synergistes jonesii]OFB67603.1 hypothetical protein JS78_06335 [Synergistes jonesii]
MANSLKDFTNIYQLSKTLRFELKPIGKTEEHINRKLIIMHDEKRGEDYKSVTKLIDDYHRKFIHETLDPAHFDWNPLAEALIQSGSKNNKALPAEQKEMREKIISMFTSQAVYKKLFKKELFSELLPEMIKSELVSDLEKQAQLDAVKSFDKFSTYFTGFHENRKNIYSKKDTSTSIAFRIVHQNFPKFLANVRAYTLIKERAPEVIDKAQKELSGILGGKTLDDIFSIESFNNVLTQDKIDYYNQIIGGVSGKAGDKKLRGVNEFSNLYRQQHPEVASLRIKMVPLYKQILSDRTTLSFVPEALKDDEQAINAVDGLRSELERNDIFNRIKRLFGKNNLYSLDKIWIKNSSISAFSNELFKNWSFIEDALKEFKENEFNGARSAGKKAEKWLKSKYFSFADIDAAVKSYSEQVSADISSAPSASYFAKFTNLIETAAENGRKFSYFAAESKAFRGDDGKTEIIKAYLDSLNDILHCLKPFETEDISDIDTEFYSAFAEIYDSVKDVIPVYNAVRNYTTQKPFSTEKFKLNFENPALAKGWDKNKEQNNTAIILMKDGKYYLGVIDKNNKLRADDLADDGSAYGYMKMNYKFIPTPHMELPKVFLPKRAPKRYNPSREILLIKENKTFIKDKNFNRTDCHKLIDFFKDSINKHKDWRTFGFDFSDTDSYEDISDFYMEVQDQGYKLTFTRLSAEKIDKWVEEGRLFLFQIYNKDFADGAQGSPNLHTLYWKAIFSEENLKDVVLKLNGEAELFFRRKSIDKPAVHAKGSMKVNRRDIDGNPIDEGTYVEICGYANGKRDMASLNAGARGLIESGLVRITEVKHELVKDKRYTIDKYFFHVPFTINFKAQGQGNINSDVNLFLRNNKDVNIIGIDRGERNLVYVSLIDRDGHIKLQKDFNIIGGMDYHAKLNQKEKERDTARKSWKTIGTIKELKEGYLSQVVHEIVRLAVDNNAVIVMEDLNIGFKRGRFKVEKQVYQKFEKMLIDKLNYLVFKDAGYDAPCGILKGLQLTEKFESFTKLGKQCGIIFYIPAGYTSKIDPTTGFVNLFNINDVSSKEKQKDFIGKLDSIRFDAKRDMFTFEFDYDKFRTYQTSYRKKWAVWTNGKRIVREKDKDGKFRMNDRLLTEDMKNILNKYALAYKAGEDILPDVISRDKSLASEIFYVFKNTLQMRNSKRDTGEDFIISPVLNAKGRFFDSRKTDAALPIDADANGAYHIALKGSLVLDAIDEKLKEDGRIDYKDMAVSNPKWFEFMQTRKFDF